jgi:hypothetical protein
LFVKLFTATEVPTVSCPALSAVTGTEKLQLPPVARLAPESVTSLAPPSGRGVTSGAGVVVSVPPHCELDDAATFNPVGNQAEIWMSLNVPSPPLSVNVSSVVCPIDTVLGLNDVEIDGGVAALAPEVNAHKIVSENNTPTTTRFI